MIDLSLILIGVTVIASMLWGILAFYKIIGTFRMFSMIHKLLATGYLKLNPSKAYKKSIILWCAAVIGIAILFALLFNTDYFGSYIFGIAIGAIGSLRAGKSEKEQVEFIRKLYPVMTEQAKIELEKDPVAFIFIFGTLKANQ